MLARRFTIICLMTSIFGMLFASLAVQSDGPRFAELHGQQFQCAFMMKTGC